MPIAHDLEAHRRPGWARASWMRLAALSVLGAAIILIIAPVDALQLRQAAQIQFMHAMGTFACATFMNIGADRARYAPACFMAGTMLHCTPVYMLHLGGISLAPEFAMAGSALLLCGWCVLIAAAGSID